MKKITIVAIVSLTVSLGLHASWFDSSSQPQDEASRRLEALQANKRKHAILAKSPTLLSSYKKESDSYEDASEKYAKEEQARKQVEMNELDDSALTDKSGRDSMSSQGNSLLDIKKIYDLRIDSALAKKPGESDVSLIHKKTDSHLVGTVSAVDSSGKLVRRQTVHLDMHKMPVSKDGIEAYNFTISGSQKNINTEPILNNPINFVVLWATLTGAALGIGSWSK